MSLQVWLPLNGNLENQGLSNLTASGNPVWKTYGKIGSKALDLQNRITFSTPNLNGVQFFSVAFWGRIEANSASTANWMDVIGFTDVSTSGASGSFRFETGYGSAAYGGIHWHDNATNAIINGSYTYNTAAEYNNWHHIVVTVSDTELKSYYDGQLVNTKTDNLNKGHLNGSWWIGESTSRGCIQDVRIYNHCLSAKEVKEIAKGLVLHYKLDDFINLNTNLMPNYLEMNLGSANASTGTWRTAGTNNMTRTRININDSPEGQCYGFQNAGIQTANDGSCYGIDNFPLAANTTYTISMWARIIDGTEGYAGFNIYNLSAENGGSHSKIDKNYRVTTLPSDGGWVKCWYTFTTNSSTTRNIYIGITTGATSVTTQMCCIHIEKINRTNFTTIYDSSGYGNHGDATEDLTIGQSPRFLSAKKLCGTTIDNSSNTKVGAAYIRGFLSLSAPAALTIAWWGKNTKYGRGGILQTTSLADPSECTDYNTTAIANWDSTFGIYNGTTRVNIFSSFLKDNTWHHHAITFNGANVIYYLDGIQKQSSALTGTLPAISGFCMGLGKAGGVYRQIDESLSDVRIYATALTPAAIQELYHTSASIDNHYNGYSYELQEDGRGQITQQGIMNFTSFYELDNLAKILATKDFEANQFYEY